MAGASAVHLPAGFFAQSGGLEHPALLGWTAACLGLTGPGRLSLDHATGHVLNKPWVIATAFTTAAATAYLVIGRRARHLRESRDLDPEDAARAAAGDAT
jgi:putative oxidoreductase